ncbi:hypothetical protein WDU94_013975 [Cyamophila willieti]
MAIQEIRWHGQGRIDKKEFTLIYSGPDKRTGQLGTGFMINKTIRNSIMDYNTVNDRICKLRLKGTFRNITLISVHAPTEEKADEDKEFFYEDLDRVISQVQRYDLIIVLGDFNAKIGYKEKQPEVAGPFTRHDYNNSNGDYLADFAARNKLFIRSTSFEHKNIHLGTWKVPGTNETNQIDHVLITSRHYSSIKDVRSCRGPNIDSDHYLVKTLLREKLSTIQSKRRAKQTKWNTDKLKENADTLALYQDTLSRTLNSGTDGTSIDEKWDHTKQAIIKTAQETLGKKEPERNMQWFDEECKAITEEKNKARNTMLSRNSRSNGEKYKDLRRKAKAIMKKKKKNCINDELRRIDELNKEGEDRKFYAAMKKIKKEFQPRTAGCRNERGNIITDEKEITAKWVQHFKQLLNKETSAEGEQLEQSEETRQRVNTTNTEHDEPPSIDEIRKAIQKMRNNRAPGEDGIVTELIKYGGDVLVKHLQEIIKDIWDNERMPDKWNIGIICPIHKKGDKTDCANYRGVMLLDTSYKILTSIINNRVKKISNNQIGEYQCGFRESKGTTDQLFVVRQIMEKCHEHNIDLNILFVDFKQAFDSIKRSKLIEAMEDMDIPQKLINLIMMSMEKSRALVKIDKILSDEFDITTGVRQGDGLSTTLFIIALHKVIQRVDQRGTIFNKSSQICAYADDIGIIARTKQRLIEVYKEIEEYGKELGLRVNENKTEYMKVSASEERRTMEDLTVGDKVFKAVSQFKYLGEIVTNDGKTSTAIKDRLQCGNRAYFANLKLLKNKLISRKTKLKIYKTLIRPVVTYGSEAWAITQQDQEKIRRFERKIIRKIYGPICENGLDWRIRNNQEIKEIMQGEDIVKFIKSQRLRWLGHVYRMDEDRMPKKILNAKVYNNRRRGRPRLRWKDEVLKDLKAMKVEGWIQLVNNRAAWRHVCEEAKAHPGL